MRAVIQRVINSSVSIDENIVGRCEKGFMILFCAMEGDKAEDVSLLAKKVANLRVFEDDEGKMNRSVLDISGGILCISQFTLAADTKKGNRPSFIKAMKPETASRYYDLFCEELKNNGIKSVEKGVFGADMKVSLINDGPVTIILDTDVWKKKNED